MTAALKRLEELLDAKDAEIVRLETEIQRLEDAVASSASGWSLPREASDEHPELPLPRLEMTWTQRTPGSWSSYVVEYRLVYRHLCDHVVVVPLGSTRVDGGGLSPFGAAGVDHALPYRDGAHLMHDAAHLGLPAYAIAPSGPERVDQSENYKHQRETSASHRRASSQAPSHATPLEPWSKP